MSKVNRDGVVESDSDELENRFESGKANLSTSCIALNALELSSNLEEEIGERERALRLQNAAEELRKSISSYFGRTVEGYETYRYCAEEKRLRSWICLPLLSGIEDRKSGTIDALLSDKLRRGVGLSTRSGGKTYWDRSTLYALRALFRSGETERGLEFLKHYTHLRLLGAHHPYCVEAYPEGNQAQLSAESGLYLRALTEGIFGYRPIGFARAEIAPRLPKEWNEASLCGLSVGGKRFDILLKRLDSGYEVFVNGEKATAIDEGEKYTLGGSVRLG